MESNILNINDIDNYIGIDTIIQKARAFSSGEITEEEFSDFNNQLVVITSLPILKKISILSQIIEEYHYPSIETQAITCGQFYKNLFFLLYLQGYLNILDITEKDITYENYDLLEPLYGPWIERYSGRDIQLFKEMMQSALSFDFYKNSASILEGIDTNALESATKSNKELIKEIEQNKELIQNLRDMAVFNSPYKEVISNDSD